VISVFKRGCRCLSTALLYVALISAPQMATAQSLIRDAEIENTIRTYSEPIFAAAGLVPENVKIHIVNDSSLNAFVAGGQRMFIHTGLITALDRPRQLIGVIAHETGHIAGGHLSRGQEALAGATIPVILGTLLAAAAFAAGSPDAGAAALLGSQHIAQRTVLQYSRTQESAADQAAVKYLEATGQSGVGILETFDLFGDQEILTGRAQDPYARTHPLSRDRVSALKNTVDNSPYKDVPESADFVDRYDRMKAKIQGFIDRPDVALRRYPLTDKSLPARYARAVAYWRMPDFASAMTEIDSLIAEEPNNPYFHELKGQIILDAGKPAEAVVHYGKSVELAKNEPLLKVNLGHAMLSTEDPAMVQPALEHLQASIRKDKDNSFAWYQLAIAYGRSGDTGMAELATSERHYNNHNLPGALHHANRALKILPKGSPGHTRANDIVFLAAPKDGEKQKRPRG